MKIRVGKWRLEDGKELLSPRMSGASTRTGMPRDLLLVRHGHSEGNLAREAAKRGDESLSNDDRFRDRSAANWRLTSEGKQEAETAGEWIRTWMNANGVAHFDRYYCSPFVRTRETAGILQVPGAEWRLESLLRERDFGLHEGLSPAETKKTYPRSVELKQRNRFLWRPDSGESTPDLDLRIREVLATLAREMADRRVICVTHEDVMWAFRYRLEKMTVDEWLEADDHPDNDIANCGILHYTRTSDDDTVAVADRFIRVRLISPGCDPEPDWLPITRPRYSDGELLEQVDTIPPVWPDR